MRKGLVERAREGDDVASSSSSTWRELPRLRDPERFGDPSPLTLLVENSIEKNGTITASEKPQIDRKA